MKTNSQKTNSIWFGGAIGLALLLLFAAPQRAVAQWATSGNNISNTNTGNVGVGTTSPDKLLTVQGTVPAPLGAMSVFRTTGSNNGAGLLMDATGTGNNNIGFSLSGVTKGAISLDNSRSFLGLINLAYSPNDFSLRLNSDGSLTYHDSASAAERFRITAAGNVGIGTASPGAKLDLSGSTSIQYVTLSDATSYGAISFRETGGSEKGHIGMTGSGSGSTYIGGANAFQIWNG